MPSMWPPLALYLATPINCVPLKKTRDFSTIKMSCLQNMSCNNDVNYEITSLFDEKI